MRFVKKTLLLAIGLYFFHLILGGLTMLFFDEKDSDGIQYGFLASAIYILMIAGWAYLLFAVIYCSLSLILTPFLKAASALLLTLAGYFLSMAGHIIDNDFYEKFDWRVFVAFLLTAPFMFWAEGWIKNKWFSQ